MAAKIKTGDEVIVIAGKDKGKKGKITKIIRDENRVVVSGVNVATKHQKPAMGEAGGIKKIELPIQISNIALLDPKQGMQQKLDLKLLTVKKLDLLKNLANHYKLKMEMARPETKMTARLNTLYKETIRKELTEKFDYKNPMQVPKL